LGHWQARDVWIWFGWHVCAEPVAPNDGGFVSNARDPFDRDKFQHPGELPTNDQAFYLFAQQPSKF